jgi:hypothetical protein
VIEALPFNCEDPVLNQPWAYGMGWPLTWSRHALPFYALRVGNPYSGLTAVSGVAPLQGRRPAAVFYPFGHPTLGCPLSHDPLLYTSLRGPKRVRLVISNLNRVVTFTLVEGTSGGREDRYFSLCQLVRIKHNLRELHFSV